MAKVAAKEKIAESVTVMFDSINKSVQEAAKAASTGMVDDSTSKLAALEKEYQTVTVKIYRKAPNGAKMEFFTELQGFPLSELLERGPDSICREEGGGGEYSLKVYVPGDRGAARVALPVTVSGPARQIPMHSALLDNAFGFGTPGMGGIPGFGVPNSTPFNGPPQKKEDDGKAAYAQQRQYEQLMQSSQNSSDRLMMLMMAQQQQQQQQAQQAQQTMAQMFSGMFQAAKPDVSSSENDRVRRLEEKLERMHQEAQQREELARRDREISELKQRMETHATRAQGSGEKDWLVPLVTMMSSSSQGQMSSMVDLMKMLQDKPSEMERIGNLMATVSSVMNNSFQGQAQLLQTMKEMAAGGEPSTKDFLFKGLEGLMEIGSQALEASVQKAQFKSEAAAVAPQMPMMVPQPPQMQQAQALGSLPAHEEEEEQEVPEIEEADEEQVELLTEDELDRLERDAALQRAIASLMNGDHVSEATARIYAHGSSGNTIARKWLMAPYDITRQVLEPLDALTITTSKRRGGVVENVEVDLVKALGDDVVLFAEFLKKGGDPQTWAKTGYPFKRKSNVVELDSMRPTSPPPAPLDSPEPEEHDQEEGEEDDEHGNPEEGSSETVENEDQEGEDLKEETE